MPTNFIIKLVVYPFEIMVSIDEPDEVLFARLVKYGNPIESCERMLTMDDTGNYGKCAIFDTNQTVIRLRVTKNKYEFYNTVAHEVFHAATFILDRIGMKLELMVSDEAYAYLVGFITAEIYIKLKP